MKLPVPVNIITGALGVGKTTAIQHLLRSKPPGEKWAVLVNEFGALGIDAALIEAAGSSGGGGGSGSGEPPAVGGGSGGGLVVRELAGGCLCCTLSGPLGVAVAQLVRQAKPDRLIIEPSGLGHPAGLLDTLQGQHLRSALDVRAIICLVDIAAAADPGSALHTCETFVDQVNVADVIVGHKADAASEQQVEAFWAWAQELYPPKLQVLEASHGVLDLQLLDLPRQPVFAPLFKQAHSSARRRAQQQHRQAAAATAATCSTSLAADAANAAGDAGGNAANISGGGEVAGTADHGGGVDDGVSASGAQEVSPGNEQPQLNLQPGQPARFPSPGAGSGVGASNSGSSSLSCGWLFSSEDVFDRGQLLALLTYSAVPAVQRLKGIFRVGKGSYVVPHRAADGALELRAIAYRRESRLEVIVAALSPSPQLHPCPAAAAAECAGTDPGAVVGRDQQQQVAAALACADWAAFEALLVGCLVGPR